MASKYDSYWKRRLPDLGDALASAAHGRSSRLDTTSITTLGDRQSWYGKATVRGRELVSAHMAHARSLGRVVADSGLADRWPALMFDLRIDQVGNLTVTLEDSTVSDSWEPGRTRRVSPTRSSRESRSDRENNPSGGTSIDPDLACARIHALLTDLPVHDAPDNIEVSNGLYFFYEDHETSAHAPGGRIVRIGNHPRSQNRLRGRLHEHYRNRRNGKNGSVFRRYVGGALLRASDPNHRCLEPEPGRGHWESQDGAACDICSPIEGRVSQYLSNSMRFRVVRIDDQARRNHFEARLIATVAACPVCRPSKGWLGGDCYQPEVRDTGLWNQQLSSGPPVSVDDLSQFENLVRDTNPRSSRAPAFGKEDLSDTLLVIPCCSAKKGRTTSALPARRVADYLPEDTVEVLKEGRRAAFARQKVSLDLGSPLVPALDLYTGQPYATDGFRRLLIDALERGMHCLIISGGYGLVRPEEPIHTYKAHLAQHTRSVWRQRLAELLPIYVHHNQIRRAYITLSNTYAQLLPRGFAVEEWWGIPMFDSERDSGAPLRVVPERVGRLVTDLLALNLYPSSAWEHRRADEGWPL